MFHQHLSSQRLKEELESRKASEGKDKPKDPAQPAAVQAGSRRKRILVVDDESSVTVLLRLFLEMEGYDCATASDGESGLEYVKSRGWDLVISDVVMGAMDGVEFCKLARKEKKTLPFIFVTGYPAVTERRQEEEHLKEVPILFKPVEIEELRKVIRQALDSTVRAKPDEKASAGD